MKYNPISGVGIELRLFEKDFFSTNIERKGNEYFYKGRKIAERKSLYLTQHEIYKTQFSNPELSKAFDQIHPDTFWEFKGADGNVLQNIANLPTLKKEIASFVYETEPKNPPTQVSVVLYEGPTEKDLLLSDGSSKMDVSYYPIENQDIVTKQYVDDYLTNWAAAREEISTFSILKADGSPLDVGYRYTDNEQLPVLCIQKYIQGRAEDCIIHVDSFSIPPTWNKPTISIMINNIAYYTTTISQIVAGTNSMWKLESSKNIYTEDISNTYWRNSYTLSFNPTDHPELIGPNKNTTKDITAEIRIKVWDNDSNVMYSEKKIIGIDYWMWKTSSENRVQYISEELQQNKTLWISGVSYYPNTDATFNIPLQIILKNNFLSYYRPNIVARLFGIYNQEQILLQEFSLDHHTPLFNPEWYEFSTNIQYKVGIAKLKLIAYNIQGKPINETTIDFNAETDISDESNRVTTPSGEEQYPIDGYGQPWDSTASLQEQDMFLRNGIYTYTGNQVEKSAVCFKVTTPTCYSHLEANIEHDGDMYIKVQGKTGWLDCNRHKDAILDPIWSGDGCLVNDLFYSFGRVVYSDPIFIRIIHATKVIFKSSMIG